MEKIDVIIEYTGNGHTAKMRMDFKEYLLLRDMQMVDPVEEMVDLLRSEAERGI
jgi:hypothetical protein